MSIFRKLLKQLLPLLLRRFTGVTRIVTASDQGEFAFLPQDRFIGWKLALQGTRDPALTAFARTRLKAGDLAIDAGANLGWFSVVLGNCVGPQGRVMCFEPEPGTFQLLAENTRRNGVDRQATLHNLALASGEKPLALEIAPENLGDHRIRVGDARPGRYDEARRAVTAVAARRLDDVMRDATLQDRAVRLFKIDCQGYELEILRGAPETLARTECLLLEYWPYGLRRCGADPAELLRLIAKRFTHFARIEDGRDPAFRPVAGLDADAATVADAVDYAFVRQ